MPSLSLPHIRTSLSLHPSASVALLQTLHTISDLLNTAVVIADTVFTFALNQSARRHLTTPWRKQLYQWFHQPYSQPPLDTPNDDHAAAACIHRLLCKVLTHAPPTSLPQSQDEFQRTVTPLSATDLAFQVMAKIWNDVVILLRSKIHLWFTVFEDPLRQFFVF